MGYLEVLNARERVVFDGRGLVEVVMPDTGNIGVPMLNTAVRLLPIVAELERVAQRLLRFSLHSLMFSKTV